VLHRQCCEFDALPHWPPYMNRPEFQRREIRNSRQALLDTETSQSITRANFRRA
jgi:hypothetical protein